MWLQAANFERARLRLIESIKHPVRLRGAKGSRLQRARSQLKYTRIRLISKSSMWLLQLRAQALIRCSPRRKPICDTTKSNGTGSQPARQLSAGGLPAGGLTSPESPAGPMRFRQESDCRPLATRTTVALVSSALTLSTQSALTNDGRAPSIRFLKRELTVPPDWQLTLASATAAPVAASAPSKARRAVPRGTSIGSSPPPQEARSAAIGTALQVPAVAIDCVRATTLPDTRPTWSRPNAAALRSGSG